MLLAVKENWDNDLEQKLSDKYGVIGTEPLEDIIDYGNIHGLLQSKLSMTEGRLAMAVTQILSQDTSRIDKLIQVAYEFGKKYSVAEDANTDQAFQVLNDSLIDEMPCDGVNELLERKQNHLKWQQTNQNRIQSSARRSL